MKLIFPALSAILLFVGCQKFTDNLADLNAPEQEWLLPVAKSTIDFDDIREVTDIKLELNVDPADFSLQANVWTNVPPFSGWNIGPDALDLPAIIHEVRFDSLAFEITLTNPFPFSIGAGTQITYRNSPSTDSESNVLLRWNLEQAIPAGQSATLTQTVSGNYVQESVYVFIENFSTPGGNNLYISNTPLLIETNFKLIDISRIELNEGHTLTSIDTVGVVIEIPDEADTNDTDTRGTATLYFDNTLPVNQRFQAYFLRNNIVVDSLLVSPALIAPSNNDSEGNPLNTLSSESSATLTWDRLNNLSTCDKMVIHHYISTISNPNNPIVANKSASLKVQLVVDLKINLSIFQL